MKSFEYCFESKKSSDCVEGRGIRNITAIVGKTSSNPRDDQWIPIMTQLLIVPLWIQVRYPVAQITDDASITNV